MSFVAVAIGELPLTGYHDRRGRVAFSSKGLTSRRIIVLRLVDPC